jgi:hypothetical protein
VVGDVYPSPDEESRDEQEDQDHEGEGQEENLAALGLPALWERFKEATGDTTKSPNKKFLVRRIEEALAARAVEPAFVEESTRSAHATSAPESETTPAESTPPKPCGRFAAMTIEELQTKCLEVVGRATGSNDRRLPQITENTCEINVFGLATPERERWIVQTESFYDARGRVYLELADATPAEAERGMAMLKKLAG